MLRLDVTFVRDRERGTAGVHIPYALARKYPNALFEWPWQWVFPSAELSRDPRDNGEPRRHHLAPETIQRHMHRAARSEDGERLRHPHRTGTVGTS